MSKLNGLVGVMLLVGLTPLLGTAQTPQAMPEVLETSVALSHDEASLELLLSGNQTLSLDFVDGRIFLDGSEVARYELGGSLEEAWRDFLEDVIEGELSDAWSSLDSDRFEGLDAAALSTLIAAVTPRLAGAIGATGTLAPVAPRVDIEPVTIQVDSDRQTSTGEIVDGGLVLVLPNLDGTARSLERLWPGLPRQVSEALEAPLRLVIDADRYRLPEGVRIDESLVLVETDGTVAGTVAGDVIVAEGSLRITPTARIEGDVVAIDADVHNAGGTVMGAIRDIEDTRNFVVAPLVAPPVRIGQPARWSGHFRNVFRGVGSLFQTFAAYLILLVIGAFTVYFFRGHLEVVSDTVSYSFGRAFLAGLAAEVLFFPILLVLVVLVLTWIAIPFYILAAGLSAILGYLAVAHAAGENLTRRRYPTWAARLRRSNSYYYVLNGLALLLALYAVAAITQMGGPFLGWANGLLVASAGILTWVAATSGLGAVMLSRAGTRRDFARPRELPELPAESFIETELDIRPAESPRRSTQEAEQSDEV